MPIRDVLSAALEAIGRDVVDSAYSVHVKLGAGLLESIYRQALAHELRKRGHVVDCEVPVPVFYDGVELTDPLRIDLLVDRQVIVEVKAVLQMRPVFKSQTLSYLKLANLQLAFLINFNVTLIKDGIERIVRF